MSMDDSSNGRAVALYPADPGSNPRSGSIWDFFVSETRLDGYIMSDPLTNWNPKREVDLKYIKKKYIMSDTVVQDWPSLCLGC